MPAAPSRVSRLSAYAVATVVVAVGLVFAFRHGVAVGLAALGAAILLGVCIGLAVRLVRQAHVSRALTDAALSTPWPAEEIDAMLLRLVRSHVRSDTLAIGPRPSSSGAGGLWAPLDGGRTLLLGRRPGALRFTRLDARLVAGLASMARTSHESADREALLRHEAVTDNLTGLWDYGYWRARLVDADDRPATGVGVTFLDLDDFRHINSDYGHLEADAVLATLGRRLAADGRAEMPALSTATFCRFGGDEFAGWWLDVPDAMDLDWRCAELAQLITRPVQLPSGTVEIHASIGRAFSDDPHVSVDDLIARAEVDLRRRKAGRLADLQLPVPARTSGDLARSLLDDGLIGVAFQPIIDRRREVTTGWEVLLRGRLDSGYHLPPPLLIESAVAGGHLDELTAAVADQAIATVRRAAQLTGQRLLLTLNVELQQLREDNDLLDHLVSSYDPELVKLVLEVSERGIGDWTETHTRIGHALRSHGIGLAVDDVGSDQSQIPILMRYDWDYIKLDRAFLGGSPLAIAPVLGHTAAMVHELGMTAILEGVETPGQLSLAAAADITLVQGNLIGPPIPSTLLLGRLERLSALGLAAAVAPQ